MKRLLVYRNLIRFTVGDGCWLWQGALYDGYGHAWRGARETLAHRAVYEELIGPVPSGLTLDHLCRVRNCVNPGHLEPVTAAENILRGIGWGALNARKTHCNYGHEYRIVVWLCAIGCLLSVSVVPVTLYMAVWW